MEDGDAGVTIGGGEEDLRPLGKAPRVLLRSDGWSHRSSSSGEVYVVGVEAGQDRQC